MISNSSKHLRKYAKKIEENSENIVADVRCSVRDAVCKLTQHTIIQCKVLYHTR